MPWHGLTGDAIHCLQVLSTDILLHDSFLRNDCKMQMLLVHFDKSGDLWTNGCLS